MRVCEVNRGGVGEGRGGGGCRRGWGEGVLLKLSRPLRNGCVVEVAGTVE